MKRLFVDTNIWIFLSHKDHILHQQAVQSIQTFHHSGYNLILSNQVIREFLSQELKGQPTKQKRQETVELITEWRNNFSVIHDDGMVMDQLLQLVDNKELDISGRLIHDANIVATMLTHRIYEILTHNVNDFRFFESLITIHSIS
jgi:predicted nucleic acid-binding protein